MALRIDTKQMHKAFGQLSQVVKDLPKKTLDEFKKNTPIDKGNARRNTRLKDDTIIADYAYAERLENNWSPQTKGRGIIAPTIEWLEKEFNRRIKGIK